MLACFSVYEKGKSSTKRDIDPHGARELNLSSRYVSFEKQFN